MVCLLSSFFHEAGHLLPLYFFHAPAKRVVFGCFGIRIEQQEDITLSYKQEAVIALGGIAVNILLALLGLAFWKIKGNDDALIFITVNIFIALLNSIPVSVLDYGRFLRYILLEHFDEEKVNRISDKVSDVSVGAVILFCVIYTLTVGLNVSLVAVCLYLLILNLQERWK